MTTFAHPIPGFPVLRVWRRVSQVGRYARVAGRYARSAPSTSALIAILLVTTVLVQHVLPHEQSILRWGSTNIDNLTSDPVRAFVASALILPGEPWLPYAVILALSLGLLERRVGTLRALAVFASAHVLATVLTEGGEWIGLRIGVVPDAVRDQLDVGVSYGMWAAIAATPMLLPRRWRLPVIMLLSLGVIVPIVTDYNMTAAGHVLSFSIGLAWWPVLLRRTRRSATAEQAADAAAGQPAEALAR